MEVKKILEVQCKESEIYTSEAIIHPWHFQYCELPVIGKDLIFSLTINGTFYYLLKSNLHSIPLEINHFYH
jgi:hypothetical protein